MRTILVLPLYLTTKIQSDNFILYYIRYNIYGCNNGIKGTGTIVISDNISPYVLQMDYWCYT
jgi:hypothetical protein